MDYLTKEQRHKNMAANKGKGTKLDCSDQIFAPLPEREAGLIII